MKKLTFLSIMILMVMTLSGCKKGNVSIKASQIDTNTMLIKSDGTVQVATVEDFSASYYDLEELKTYIQEHVDEYNQQVGNETAVTLDSLDKKENMAIMVLEYASMDYYADFNEVEAKYLVQLTESDLVDLPESLNATGDEGTVSKAELLSLENVHVVLLNEEYHLIVSDKIKYYGNGTVTDDKEADTSADGTVIVY